MRIYSRVTLRGGTSNGDADLPRRPPRRGTTRSRWLCAGEEPPVPALPPSLPRCRRSPSLVMQRLKSLLQSSSALLTAAPRRRNKPANSPCWQRSGRVPAPRCSGAAMRGAGGTTLRRRGREGAGGILAQGGGSVMRRSVVVHGSDGSRHGRVEVIPRLLSLSLSILLPHAWLCASLAAPASAEERGWLVRCSAVQGSARQRGSREESCLVLVVRPQLQRQYSGIRRYEPPKRYQETLTSGLRRQEQVGCSPESRPLIMLMMRQVNQLLHTLPLAGDLCLLSCHCRGAEKFEERRKTKMLHPGLDDAIGLGLILETRFYFCKLSVVLNTLVDVLRLKGRKKRAIAAGARWLLINLARLGSLAFAVDMAFYSMSI